MENSDLGSKKMNGKQSENDDLIQGSHDNDSNSSLQLETEINEKGEEKMVERARSINPNDAISKSKTNAKVSSKPSTAYESLGKKMVENQDKNSDITPNRTTDPESNKRA